MQGAFQALGIVLGVVAIIGLLAGAFALAAAIGAIICAGLLIWAIAASIYMSWRDWRGEGSKDHPLPPNQRSPP